MNYLYPISTVFPYNTASLKPYEERFFDALIKNDDTNFLNSSTLLLNSIAENYFEFLLENYATAVKMRIFVLIDYGCKVKNDSFIIQLVNSLNGILPRMQKTLAPNKLSLYFNRLYDQRGNLKTCLDYQNKLIPGYGTLAIMLAVNYYNAIVEALNDDAKTRVLIKELLDLYAQKRNKDCVHIFYGLKKAAEMHGKRNLSALKQAHHATILKIRASEKDPDLLDALNGLIDFIEGRSMENISNKLSENIQNVEKISDNLVQTDIKVNVLDANVKKVDKKIDKVDKNVGKVTRKVGELDKRVDEQGARIEQIDEKTLLNLPLWCKQIRNSVINSNSDWVLIAKRLNFSDQDIKGWLNQVDPFLSMLQEWFIANKTADAINGLLAVFKELNNAECVQIIQTNIDKVELESVDLFKDKGVDERIVNSPAQVFISYEWSSKKKAKLLRDMLVKRLNMDYGLAKENNRYLLKYNTLRSFYLFSKLITTS